MCVLAEEKSNERIRRVWAAVHAMWTDRWNPCNRGSWSGCEQVPKLRRCNGSRAGKRDHFEGKRPLREVRHDDWDAERCRRRAGTVPDLRRTARVSHL